MRKFIQVIFALPFFAYSQEKFTLSGTVSDAENNEMLIGVSLFVTETKASAVTNEYGFYSLTLPQGQYTVQISSVGYQNVEEKISLNQNTKRNFSLSKNIEQLSEVVITDGQKKAEIRRPVMSLNKLTIQEIKAMPV